MAYYESDPNNHQGQDTNQGTNPTDNGQQFQGQQQYQQQQYQTYQGYQAYDNYVDTGHSPTKILIFGLISILSGLIFGWTLIVGIVSIVFGALTISWSKKFNKANPGNNNGQVRSGRICGIIGLIFGVLGIVGCVIILAVVGCGSYISKTNTAVDESKPSISKQESFVESNDIEIVSANQVFSAPAYTYAYDDSQNEIDIEGLVFKQNNASYRFYDYSKEFDPETNCNMISFSYDVTIPMECVVDAMSKNSIPTFQYDTHYFMPDIIDGNTGNVYEKEKIGINDTSENMKYNNVTWNGKTYTVGVKAKDVVGKWDGRTESTLQDGSPVYNNTFRRTVKMTISVPSDYDEPLIALSKVGIDRDLHNVIKNYSGTKEQGVHKYYESNYRSYAPDDFYILRPSDIQDR